MNDDTIIWRQDLIAKFGIVSETLRRWRLRGRLPKPDIEVSQKTVGWKVSTLRSAGINV